MKLSLQRLEDLSQSIEDKILERGTLTKYFGELFNLEICPIKSKNRFTLEISITEVESIPDHKACVEITNYIHNLFFDSLKNKFNESDVNTIKNHWQETVLVIDGKTIFVID